MDDSSQNILLFCWRGDLPDEDDYPDPEKLTCMLSRAPASALCSVLQERGLEINGPHEGDSWWEFDIRLRGEPFSVSVMWTGIGRDEDDRFVVQCFMRQGCLASIFKNKAPAERLEPVVGEVRRAVDEIREIDKKHWVTEKAFHDYYGGGKPFDL